MSGRPHRTRGAVKTPPSREFAASSRWKYRRIVGLGLLLVATVFLTNWVRRQASLGGSQAEPGFNVGAKSSAVAPLKPTLSPTSSAEEIMGELRRVADQLAKSFPRDATALNVLAQVEFGLGHRAEAMEIWSKCAELSPQDASPYFAAMGNIAANSGEPDQAAELFRNAIERGDRDPQTPALLAENLMRAGNLDEAVLVLERHLQNGSVYKAAFTTLGQAYLELDQCEKAKEAFLNAIQTAPNNKAAHYGLARSYARLDDQEQAARSMEQFTKLDTQQSSEQTNAIRTFNDDASTRQMALRALIDAARCYRGHQQMTDAEQLLQNAAALAPDDAESRLDLVTLYEQTRREQAALEICKQLQMIDPKNGDYWLNEGVLSARMGKLEQGLSALKQALQLDPHNQRYREAHDLIRRESER
jgi:tetratricopeptide (TPR) repeat protein